MKLSASLYDRVLVAAEAVRQHLAPRVQHAHPDSAGGLTGVCGKYLWRER